MPGGRKDRLTHSKPEQLTTENGLVASEMDTEFKSGQMVHNMKDNGRIIELTVKESLCILTETFTMANGSTIRRMGMESITISTEPCMRDTGVTTSSTEKEKNLGPMDLFTKVSTWLERSTEWAFIAGTTAASTQENGTKTKSKDLEHTAG